MAKGVKAITPLCEGINGIVPREEGRVIIAENHRQSPRRKAVSTRLSQVVTGSDLKRTLWAAGSLRSELQQPLFS